MKISKKEFLNNVWLFFIIIPFFKPDIVASFPQLNYILSAWQVASFIYICILYFKKGKISKFVLLFLLYYLIVLIATILNNGNINKWIMNFTLYLGTIMIIERYIKEDNIKILRILVIIFYGLTIGNIWSIIKSNRLERENGGENYVKYNSSNRKKQCYWKR